jgi:N-acetylmuramoyl-L-alanine amidase
MSRTRILFLFLVFALGGWASGTRGAGGGIETAYFSGKRYLRLPDWARANNLDVRWLKRDEVMQLTNRSSRFVFAKDSRTAELNGVRVRLSFPIVLGNGTGYIAETDVQTALRPLLFTPKNRAGAKIRSIVIDPGHGGHDPGFEDGPHQEKKYTLLLAQELRDQLNQAGFSASLTRTTDVYIDPFGRPEIANRRNADLFISLHWNTVTSGKAEVKGVQTYCLTPAGAPSSLDSSGQVGGAGAKPGNRNDQKNMFLAYELHKSLVAGAGIEDREVMRARYAVLCNAEMPAVLIEGGYMSHPEESRRIYDAAYRQKMARAIVDGVLAYQQQVAPAAPPRASRGGR